MHMDIILDENYPTKSNLDIVKSNIATILNLAVTKRPVKVCGEGINRIQLKGNEHQESTNLVMVVQRLISVEFLSLSSFVTLTLASDVAAS